MYVKEVNKRSPLRILERSTHGGLGAGNVGVVLSRAGVGKTAFLVGVALDDLMRDRKVLHLTVDKSLDKVREFYDELFHDLAESVDLENRNGTHLAIERNRMIQAYTHSCFELGKVRNGVELAKEHMGFVPDAIVVDGYPDFEKATAEQVSDLCAIAKELGCEMWLTGIKHREGEELDERGVPTSVAQHNGHLSIIVELEPTADHVRLNLLKDHDSTELANLHIELDPKTLLLKWQ